MNLYIFLFAFLASWLVQAQTYVVTGSRVNFRPEASFNTTPIDVLTQGTEIKLLEGETDSNEGKYVKVMYKDASGKETPGYIWDNLIEMRSTASQDAATAGNGDTASLGNGDISLPLCGCTSCRRTSPYNPRRKHPITGRTRFHTGCDIGGSNGQTVYAAAAGKVSFSGVKGRYGNFIILEHGGTLKDLKGEAITKRGYNTRYGHLRKRLVSIGQKVNKGDAIGVVGATGSVTGPHLHFEIKINETNRTGGFIDPERVVKISDAGGSCQRGDADSGDTQNAERN